MDNEGAQQIEQPAQQEQAPIVAELNDNWTAFGPELARVWLEKGALDIFDLLIEHQANDLNTYSQTHPGRMLFILLIDALAIKDTGIHQGRARQLTTALSDLVPRNIEDPAVVYSATAAANKSAFHVYYVKELAPGERNALVNRTFARTNHHTMHFISPDNRLASKCTFIGGFKGFDDPRVPHDHAAGSARVKAHIADRILATGTIGDYVKKCPNADAALQVIRENITFRAMRARSTQGTSVMRYSAWLVSPFETQSLTLPFFASLRNDLKVALYLMHPDLGSGTFVYTWKCERCPGRDHVQTSCPFPALEGWPGKPPTVASFDAPAEQPVTVQRDNIFGYEEPVANNGFVRADAGRGRNRGRGRGNRNAPYNRDNGEGSSRGNNEGYFRGNGRGNGRGRGRGRGY